MAKYGVNKWYGMGRVTRDPDVSYTTGEKPTCIAKYALAIDNGDAAAFINCVAFGKAGEFAEKYIRKGTKLFVEGKLENNNYTNKDGQEVRTYVVRVDSQNFCESKGTSAPADSPVEAPAEAPAPTEDEEELPFN